MEEGGKKDVHVQYTGQEDVMVLGLAEEEGEDDTTTLAPKIHD